MTTDKRQRRVAEVLRLIRDAPTEAEGRLLALRYMQAHVSGDVRAAAEVINVLGPSEMLWQLSELLGAVLTGHHPDRGQRQPAQGGLGRMVDAALRAIC